MIEYILQHDAARYISILVICIIIAIGFFFAAIGVFYFFADRVPKRQYKEWRGKVKNNVRPH